jgi:hypothetical protein
MPEELPAESGAQEASESVDWEQRYKDTHSNWNTLNERMSRFEKDPNALIEFIQEKHPDLLAEEDEEEETEDEDFDVSPDPTAAELAELRKQVAEQQQWRQEIENDRGEQRFTRDLQTELGDREVNDRVKSWIKDRTYALGNNPKALKQAVEEWAEIAGELTAKPKPRASHVLPGGKTVTGNKPWSEMTESEALAAQVERAQAFSTQT